jgi:hypothetical protein
VTISSLTIAQSVVTTDHSFVNHRTVPAVQTASSFTAHRYMVPITGPVAAPGTRVCNCLSVRAALWLASSRVQPLLLPMLPLLLLLLLVPPLPPPLPPLHVIEPFTQAPAAHPRAVHTHAFSSPPRLQHLLPVPPLADANTCLSNQFGSICCALGACKKTRPCPTKLQEQTVLDGGDVGAVLQLVRKNLPQPLCK